MHPTELAVAPAALLLLVEHWPPPIPPLAITVSTALNHVSPPDCPGLVVVSPIPPAPIVTV